MTTYSEYLKHNMLIVRFTNSTAIAPNSANVRWDVEVNELYKGAVILKKTITATNHTLVCDDYEVPLIERDGYIIKHILDQKITTRSAHIVNVDEELPVGDSGWTVLT